MIGRATIKMMCEKSGISMERLVNGITEIIQSEENK